MQEKLKSIINNVTATPTQSIQKILDLASFAQLEKGDFLFKKEAHNHLEYFVLEGIGKTFLNSPEGEEITISFFMPNSILPPFTTRSIDGRSTLFGQAITPMKIASVDAHLFENLMIEDLGVRHFANTVLRHELMQKVQKEIELASLTGIKRLESLRSRFPNIENLVPHSDIASYLGITTISLSRFRSKI